MAGIGFVSYLYRCFCQKKILFILVMLLLITDRCGSSNLRRLYHTDFREIEFNFTNAIFFSQHKILTLLSKCIVSNCQTNRHLNEAFLNYCFKDECDYNNFYCLHNVGSDIVPFCADFGECGAHVRHVAVINANNPAFVDIYEVPCPVGYVQPHLRHGCFALCVKDNSSEQQNEHLDTSFNDQPKTDILINISDEEYIYNHEITYTEGNSTKAFHDVAPTSEPHTDTDKISEYGQDTTVKQIIPTHSNNGWIKFMVGIGIFLACVACLWITKKIYKCYRSRLGSYRVNKTITRKKTIYNNNNTTFNVEHMHDTTINLDRMSEQPLHPEWPSMGSSRHSTTVDVHDNKFTQPQSSCPSVCLDQNMNDPQKTPQRSPSTASNPDNDVRIHGQHSDPRMNYLKSMNGPVMMEDVRERGDGNSLNQTFVKPVC